MEEIKSKIFLVQERLRRLEGFRDISFESYLKDLLIKDAVERNLEVCLQACIDIGKMIIKREGFREPADNKGVFVVLAEKGIISEESLRFLIPMAGTRNILVHGYDRVDDTIIFGILKKHLGNFKRFLSEIEEHYVRKKE